MWYLLVVVAGGKVLSTFCNHNGIWSVFYPLEMLARVDVEICGFHSATITVNDDKIAQN